MNVTGSKLFTPSPTDLLYMIAAAEEKFDTARTCCMQDRFERACVINAKAVRESRARDVRRHMNAGDRP